METQKKPDFIGIGAQRSGTSWLYNCLGEHPGIFMPKKEVHFFDEKYENGVEWYFNLFGACGEGKLCGEITPDYMFNSDALEKLSEHCANTKLIIILREPLGRAYSAYSLFRSHGRFQQLSFQEAIDKEPFILNQSLYAEQLKNVYQRFDKAQVYVGLYDEIKSNPEKLFEEVCQFLNISSDFKPGALKQIKNSSAFSGGQTSLSMPQIQKKIERSPLKGLFKWFKSTALFSYFKSWLVSIDSNKADKIVVNIEVVSKLLGDIETLEAILCKDLSKWKSEIKSKHL